MSTPILEVRDLKKYFPMGRNRVLRAVDGVSFSIARGETLGLVGESGCGKTTCGRTAIGLYSKTGGQSLYKGKDVHALRGAARKQFCCEVQTIFQDPYASLDPKNKVIDLIAEGMDIHKLCESAAERRERVEHLMEQVGLNPLWVDRYPYEFSGGMRQRIGIARALAVDPKFIVCDEPVSALDVSIQAQVINLLKQLRDENDLSYVFIAHDMSVVRYISDRIGVMYLGHLVEEAPTDELFAHPMHPYTEALLSAVPDTNPHATAHRIHLQGEIPSPIDPPKGCVFHTRCPYATEACGQIAPQMRQVAPGHRTACLKYDMPEAMKV